MRRVVDREPLRRRDLVRADDPPHLVVQHLRSRARQRAEPRSRSHARYSASERSSVAAPCQTSSAENACTWISGHGVLDRPDDVRVVVARERRVDPALEADLRRAALPRLLGAPHDLLERNEVRRAAQVRRQLALREGAEAAAEVADVRVLDVPGHDVADLVAADLATQAVGGSADACSLSSAGFEEPRDLVLAELGAGELERKRVARARRTGRRPVRPVPRRRRARGRSRQLRVAHAARRRDRPSGRDRRRTRGRAEGAAQARARAAASPRAALDLGPRRLGVDMVDRHRRDAAPVVDPASSRRGKSSNARFGGACTCQVGPSRMPRDGDRPEMVVERRLGCAAMRVPASRGSSGRSPPGRVRARSPSARIASSASSRSSRVSPMPIRIPLVNGIASSPASRDRLEPARRELVGRGPVRSAPLAEPLRRRLEHDPHRGRDRPQRLELVARHDARVEVRQETRLLEHEPRAAREVLERRPAAERARALRARPCSAARACRRA